MPLLTEYQSIGTRKKKGLKKKGRSCLFYSITQYKKQIYTVIEMSQEVYYCSTGYYLLILHFITVNLPVLN